MIRTNPTRRQAIWSALSLAAGTTLPSAALAEEPKVEVPPYNRMSDEDEIKLGKEAAEGIEKEKKLKFVELPEIKKYVDELFQKVAKSSRRSNIPYSIKIVDTKEINAFALPGGFCYVNRGLLQWARSESELAGVLGHEVGHVVGRHGANMISRLTATESILGEASRILLGSDAPAKLLMQVGGPVALLAMLKYTRIQEFEADLLGFYNMQRASWHPQGMINLFKHFGEKSGAADSLFAVLNSHPAPADREQQVTAEMKKFPPDPKLAHDSEGFKAMQAKLKALPPPVVTEKLQND